MRNILDAGGVPVIVISHSSGESEDDPQVTIDIIKSSQTSYVAFSHVWADGMGNQDGNSLPNCQLLRLQKLASDLFSSPEKRDEKKSKRASLMAKLLPSRKPLAIWVDTLCIPRSKPHKSIAISRMNKTYAEAAKVLILDSEIYTQPFISPQISLLQLFASGWARRVWTMQEGSLGSSNLHLQTQTEAINIDKIRSKLIKDWQKRTFVTDALDMDSTLMFEDFSWLKKAYSNNYWRDRVSATAVSLHLLNGRSCTNVGDAYLCLSGMIGLEPKVTRELVDTEIEARTTKILQHLGYVPKGIIFSPGKKLRNEGYRWACEEFWKSQPYLDDGIAEIKGEEGVYLEYQGFLLERIDLSHAIDNDFIIFEDASSKLQFKATFDPTDRPISQLLEDVAYDPATSCLAVLCPEREILRSSLGLASYPAALTMLTHGRSVWDKARREPIHTRYICQIKLSSPTEQEVQEAREEERLGCAERPNFTGPDVLGSSEGVLYIPLHWYVA